MLRVRFLMLLTLLCALAACAAAGAPPTIESNPPATVVPALPTAAAVQPTDVPAVGAPSHTPMAFAAPASPTSIATVTPATHATATRAGLVSPTATPVFPIQAIDERTLAALRPLRVLGAGAAQAVALAPDGRLLAVGTGAGIALFELPSLHQVRFNPVESEVRWVEFSPDGQLLATSGVDDHSQLRRVVDSAILRAIDGTTPVFSADGRMVATTLSSGSAPSAGVWQTTDGVLLATFAGADPIFSPDGRFVATIQRNLSLPDTVTLWSTANGEPIWSEAGSVAAFSPNGQLLAAATHDTIRLLRLADNHPSGTLTTGLASPVYALAFSPDSALLRVLVGGELQVWSLVDRRLARSIPDPHPEAAAQGGSFGPGGELLSIAYSLGDAGLIYVERAEDGGTIYEGDWAADRAFSADGSTAAVLHLDIGGGGELRVLDTVNGGEARIELPIYQNISFSPDAQTLAASTGYAVELRNATDSALQRTLAVEDAPIGEPFSALRFSPDGAILSLAGELLVPYGGPISAATGWNLLASDKAAWRRAFVPVIEPDEWVFDPTGLMATAHDRVVALHPTAAVTLTLTLPVTITALALSPDGTLLAAADLDGAVQLIKTADATPAGVLEAGGPFTRGSKLIAFSADGARLGALRGDGVIVVWDVASGQPLAKLAATPDDQRLLFTADGLMAITGGSRGVAFYRLSDGALLRALSIAASDLAIGPRRRLLALLHSGQIQLWGI